MGVDRGTHRILTQHIKKYLNQVSAFSPHDPATTVERYPGMDGGLTLDYERSVINI